LAIAKSKGIATIFTPQAEKLTKNHLKACYREYFDFSMILCEGSSIQLKASFPNGANNEAPPLG